MEIGTETELNTSNLMLEIKKLRESIKGLTSSILGVLEPIEGLEYSINELKNTIFKVENIISEPTPVKVESKLEKEIREAEEEGKKIAEIFRERKKEVEIPNTKSVGMAVVPVDFKVTNDMVKQLAKEKMAAGVDRYKIKSIITSLAGTDASIADLDESNIEECYDKISKLQPENK